MRIHRLMNILFLVFFISSCQNASGQDTKKDKKEVPHSVRTNFQKKYPGESDPDWHTDSNGYWESHFKIDGVRHRADFQVDGTWVETEVSIDKKDLPKAVLKVIDERFSDEKITEVEQVDSATLGAFFDVEFKRKGKNKDVMFRASGEIIE